MTTDLTSFANDPAAGESLRAMHDGKWRKARDAAKILCKKDKLHYLPLLVEANAGLAREMIAKGLLKDAETVIDHLATFAPPETVGQLRALLQSPTKCVVTESANSGAILWTMALLASAQTQISPKDTAVIDALVSDGYSPLESTDEAATRLAAELAMVRAACTATGDGRWDEAKEALRTMPRDSIFRHWRMFLRGARHVFEEEREMAQKCFADLPPEGALARAARTFGPDLLGRGSLAPVGARVPFLLAATGQPAAWAVAILDAETATKANDPVRAFQSLVKGLKGAFPDDRPGLASLLTEGVLPFSRSMSEDDFEDGFELLNTHDGGKMGDPQGIILNVAREACLALPGENSPSELERTWGSILREYSHRDGPDPQRDAVGWHWLGVMLAQIEDEDADSPFDANYQPARKALQKALKADPENYDASISLLELLKKMKEDKEHNRLLDELVKQFPKNKKILQLAGKNALTRKTYPKALKFLHEALELDPLDREIKCFIAVTLIHQVRDLHKKTKPTAAIWEELEPLLEERSGSAHLVLSRWIARLRRSLLEIDTTAAEIAMADAVKLAPSALERLFLEEKMRESYRLPKRETLDADWHTQVLKRLPSWEEFARIFPLANFSGTIARWSHTSWARSVKHLEILIAAMIKQATDKDFAALADFLESTGRLEGTLDLDSSSLLRVVIHRILSQIEAITIPEPSARIWLQLVYLIAMEATNKMLQMQPAIFFAKIDKIVAQAEKSGIPACQAKAMALRERLSKRFRIPEPDDHGPNRPPRGLVEMLADAVKAIQLDADACSGGPKEPDKKPEKKPVQKTAAKKSAAKKPVQGKLDDNQMDFFT